METNKIYIGDSLGVLKTFPDESIDCCVTSPPYYGLRNYGNKDGQIGLEESPQLYVDKMVAVFNEVRRVLKKDGTLWLNLGDSWAGSGQGGAGGDIQRGNRGSEFLVANQDRSLLSQIKGYKPKDLIGIPWMVAFALRDAGWYLRQDIIWAKNNPMPESVHDRCTKAHEYIFLLSKSRKYYFDADAIKEPATTPPATRDKNAEGYDADYPGGDRFSAGERVYGEDGMRNKRDVWNVNVKPFKDAHFATFPDTLIVPCILAGCREGGVVLDPFMGAGTTAVVARNNLRNFIGIELNSDYVQLAERRIAESVPPLIEFLM